MIAFKYTIPTPTAERLWTDVQKLIGDTPWILKAAPSVAITPQFRDMLQQHGISAMRNLADETPSVRIIDALLGRKDALPEPEKFHLPWICHDDHFLTNEQAEGVGRMTETDHPLNVLLAPAGSGDILTVEGVHDRCLGKTTTLAALILRLLTSQEEDLGIIATANMNVAIDALAAKLASLVQIRNRRILVLQSATYLSSNGRSVKDPYHHWRLPELLRQLAKGRLDPNLDRLEIEQAKKAAQAAKYRFHALNMDWTSALQGADEEPGEDDFMNGVKLLIRKYKPEVSHPLN